jgi:hypothetical protein
MSTTSDAPRVPAAGRDLRIDFFRGLALWMIFIDHIDGNWLAHFTYHSLGFSDAREIFIFLSGISCLLLYGRLEASSGLASVYFRALYRAAQIYLGYAFVVFFTFTALFAARSVAEPYFADSGEFALLFADPGRALVAAASLYYTPGYLDILPLYLWLVAATPLMVWALRRAPAATLLASAAVWLAAQSGVLPEMPSLGPTGTASLNPLSWQLLFCLGLWTGQYFHRGGRGLHVSRSIQGLCAVIVVFGLICSVAALLDRSSLAQHLPLVGALHELRQAVHTGSCEFALRLVHFLAVAYLVASILPASHPLLRATWARPLVLTGQFSLQSFCLGAIMSVLGTLYWQAYAPGYGQQALMSLLGCTLMALLAMVLDARRGPRAVTSAAPARPASILHDGAPPRSDAPAAVGGSQIMPSRS